MELENEAMCGMRITIVAATVWCCALVCAFAAEPHWAYQTPLPQKLPAVVDASGAREPLDLFILAELERRNLKPSDRADRATLLRRATLVLHGLLPSVEELRS